MKSVLVFIVMLGTSPLFGQCWNLVWADEFNGTSLDVTKWTPQTGGGGWGNNELQHYTARAENIEVSSGSLKIVARSEVYGGNNYTSARIRSIQKGDWTYGKFEARMKLSVAKGMWPAFWMMPTDNVYGNWPNSGEIDIMELIGTYPARSYATMHTSSATAGVSTSSGSNYDLATGNFSDAFHDFRVEWSPNELKWFVDGVLFATKTPADFGGFPWRFDKDFHLILNLAVGGNWPGSPDGTTNFPQITEVEYVRVYQKNEQLTVRGLTTVEPAATTSYTTPNIAATTYNWTVPSGATIVSGQGSSQISVTWGAVSGDVTCSISTPCGTTSAAKTVSVTPNLLQNWSFESNLDNWNSTAYNGSTATFTSSVEANAPNGARIACVNTTAVSANSWHVQMSQSGINVVGGQNYTFKFKAKSNGTNKRISGAVINASTYSPYGYQQFILGSSWQECTFSFTPSVSAAVLFTLDCGFDVAEFCFDDITLGKTSLLPVEILDLQAVATPKGVQLNWQVGNETHLANYQIERWVNGGILEKIGVIAANNQKNYTFEDSNVPHSNVIYYRLRTINTDNTEGVSKIITYRPTRLNDKIKAFPNPVSDVLQIETSEKIKTIDAIDATGRIFKIPFALSNNGVWAGVSALSAGVFKIRITLMNGASQHLSIAKK